jgi:hypothetical protein
MPSVTEQNAVYLQSGNPDAEDAATLHAPGTLGARFTMQHPTSRAAGAPVARTKRYQVVRVDPALAAVVVPGSPAYWLDRATYTVTNVPNLNQLAGIFNNAPAKGNYTCVQQGGPGYPKFAAAPAINLFVIGGAINLAATVASPPAASVTLGIVPGVQTPMVGDATRHLVDLNVDAAL